jgi:ketosteroid isomerase-like protein
MRKLVLHLAIACSTFAACIFLTNIWNALTRAETPTQTRQSQVPGSDLTSSITEPGLSEIYRDYASAQTNHDVAFFERVEAHDFILFLSNGKALSRTEDIQLLNSMPTDIVYEYDDMNVQFHGDAATVTGRMSATNGSGYSYSWRWIDVCLKRGGRWQIQSTTQIN